MATCGSLRHIFESTTIPENSSSSLIDSLSSSWKQIRPLKPPADHSFTEIFGELHFKEKPNPVSSPPPSKSASILQGNNNGHQEDKWGNVSSFPGNGCPGSYHRRSESFSSLNSESLQLCTEGLGSESLDDVEDLKIEVPGTWQNHNNQENNSSNSDNYSRKIESRYSMGEKVYVRGYSGEQYRKRKTDGRTFPPPISSIGRTGKPSVCFQSYRQDGRFVLKEIRIPSQDCLQASREDGRLRLCFIQPSEQDGDDEDNDRDEAVDAENNGGEEGGEKGVAERLNEDEGQNSEDGVRGVDEHERKEEAEVSHDFERGHS